jgi:hypothetical protein
MKMTRLIERVQDVAQSVEAHSRRHKMQYGTQVDELIGTLHQDYLRVCSELLSFLDNDKHLAHLLQPVREHLTELLQRNGWNGWTLCDLAPPLGFTPPTAYPYALFAYNALHLVDDGIDGHTRYPAIQTRSIYGYLLDEQLNERQAAATSGMLGMALLNEVIRTLLQNNENGIAETLLRLSCRVYTGMFGESLTERPLSHEVYHTLVSYKSIAYQMFLDHVFFHTVPFPLRSRILAVNAGLVRLAQLVDDLGDEQNDLAENCMTVLAVRGVAREQCLSMATEALEHVWSDVQSLPDGPRDATATRLVEWVRLLQQNFPTAGSPA